MVRLWDPLGGREAKQRATRHPISTATGSFILIYVFMLLLLGVPLLCMEMIIAHWLQANNIRTWEQLVPSLGGIGYVSVLVNELPPPTLLLGASQLAPPAPPSAPVTSVSPRSVSS